MKLNIINNIYVTNCYIRLEIINYIELQMRICNGESVDDLVHKPDKLPCRRVIMFGNGGTGHIGGIEILEKIFKRYFLNT